MTFASAPRTRKPAPRKIRTLIVDDSAMVRKILSIGLGQDPEIEVMGAAADARVAMQYLVKDRPDVITLDLEMPNMDGLTFLRGLMAKAPIPTVVISSQTQRSAQATVDALAAGAVDVIAKPKMELGGGLNDMMQSIADRVKVAAKAQVEQTPMAPAQVEMPRPSFSTAPTAAPTIAPDWLIAIGASTGGVQALTAVLQSLPADTPPIVIVQHMPEGFTGSFARRLDQTCAMQVREARDGDVLQTGHVLIAPGGLCHMRVQPKGDRLAVELVEGPEVCFSRPAVDVLFKSVARHAKGRVSSAILTGMGRDGAEGQLAIRLSGGRCVAQDEASCVVYGMPKAAYEFGAPEKLVPLSEIPSWLMASCPSAAAPAGQESYRV
ncbi:chemotaxis response regulator protein-glutamate methylesterase [Thalassobius sp. Cn5-15]|uniref:protein-glutamate methylesterase/protein-glutamine glutaminase n=1 Tax=Thalassobius sp. Cn5-15 TaxID=2917763 RepID=UPI001EF3BE68|nr:chemotaxis response regulator protein-glutamate methylesterase [Thalassobius sp. Cn5-15]MCG7492806.1 chemotaxis response regulator protein-glutamate methylesterase [Thalassobius sp. Cn5-15]